MLVKDVKNGIPRNRLDKIVQPIFSTRQSSEGIGLGLSLSYELVKAQEGKLKVETKVGEASEFRFSIPYSA